MKAASEVIKLVGNVHSADTPEQRLVKWNQMFNSRAQERMTYLRRKYYRLSKIKIYPRTWKILKHSLKIFLDQSLIVEHLLISHSKKKKFLTYVIPVVYT